MFSVQSCLLLLFYLRLSNPNSDYHYESCRLNSLICFCNCFGEILSNSYGPKLSNFQVLSGKSGNAFLEIKKVVPIGIQKNHFLVQVIIKVERKRSKVSRQSNYIHFLLPILFVACKSITECSLIAKSRNTNELLILKNCIKYGWFL